MADALYFSVAVRGTYADIQSSQKALEGKTSNKVGLTPRETRRLCRKNVSPIALNLDKSILTLVWLASSSPNPRATSTNNLHRCRVRNQSGIYADSF